MNTYNVFYFGFYIALAAMFFLAGTNLAWGGWQIQIQKIPLAIAMNVILFLGLLLVMFAFFNHDIFGIVCTTIYLTRKMPVMTNCWLPNRIS